MESLSLSLYTHTHTHTHTDTDTDIHTHTLAHTHIHLHHACFHFYQRTYPGFHAYPWPQQKLLSQPSCRFLQKNLMHQDTISQSVNQCTSHLVNQQVSQSANEQASWLVSVLVLSPSSQPAGFQWLMVPLHRKLAHYQWPIRAIMWFIQALFRSFSLSFFLSLFFTCTLRHWFIGVKQVCFSSWWCV